MIISLLGWSSRGMRCPDVDIDFTSADSKPYRVSLLQMPNGTGKTTTLTLLSAALTGEASRWDPEKVKSLCRPGEEEQIGSFICRLGIDGRPLTIEMELLFDEGVVSYRTSSGSRQIAKWDPPATTRMFLNDKFVKLFVFDGEYAGGLLEAGQAEADNAIDALFQLYLFSDIAEAAQQEWDSKSKKGGPKTSQGLTSLRTTVDYLRDRHQKLTTAREKAGEEVLTLKEEIKVISSKIDGRLGQTTEIREALDGHKDVLVIANRDLDDAIRSAVEILREPQRAVPKFGLALEDLHSQLDRLKLPASTAAQWFEELADERNASCVCGRPLGSQERAAILERKGDILGSEVYGVLNVIKGDVHARVVGNREDESPLQDILDSIRKSIGLKKAAETQISVLQKSLIQAGDTELGDLQVERERKTVELKQRESILDLIDGSPRPGEGKNTKSLGEIERLLKKATIDLAKSTGTVRLRKGTDTLQRVMNAACEIARKRLREAVRVDCNKHLERILQNDPVRIGTIERHLSLEGQGGASMGQTLAVGYIFLATLLSRGQHSFPLIVDSPAGPLDGKVRAEIGRIIPALCEQFVAFTISTEREWFVDAIDDSVESEVQYLTQFRKTAGTQTLVDNLGGTKHVETNNGVLVYGSEYFNRFDLVQEVD